MLSDAIKLQEWPDSSGSDDHGRDVGGGFKNQGRGVYSNPKTGKSVIVRKGVSSKNSPNEHEVEVINHNGTSLGTTYHQSETKAAAHIQKKYGINHIIGTAR